MWLPAALYNWLQGEELFLREPCCVFQYGKLQDKRTFKELCQYKSQLLRAGLEVDQTNFEEFCRLTNFRRYYTFDGA